MMAATTPPATCEAPANKKDKQMEKEGWLLHLYENHQREVKYGHVPLLSSGARVCIWDWCYNRRLVSRGLPGQACKLLERYLSVAYALKINKEKEYGAVVERNIIFLKKNLKKMAGCCILLALKMLKQVGEKRARHMVFGSLAYNAEFNKDVIKMEYEIFRDLDFYVPTRTTVEVSQLLAAKLDMPREVCQVLEYVVSQAELCKPIVCRKMQNIAADEQKSIIPGQEEIPSLYLAAGGVAAAAELAGLNIAATLAQLTRTTEAHIADIARSILQHAHISPQVSKYLSGKGVGHRQQEDIGTTLQ